jgi:nucleotide-binding universal stress UspA family protein
MSSQILVPVDGSQLSHRAIPWADAWAFALDADVELMRVRSRPVMQATSSDDVYDYFGERESIQAQQALNAAASLFNRAQHVTTHLVDGIAANAIIDRAHQCGPMLLIMATHGRTGFTRTLMGSVAASVIRAARVPVLAIRTNLEYPPGVPERVLVPVDGSELSAAIFTYLIPIAKALRFKVVLLWVAPDSVGQAATAGRIQELAAELEAEGIEATIAIEEARDVAATIVSFASREHFGLIAMSTEGVGGNGRWTLGSVTDWTIGHAPVPVMAVKPRRVSVSRASVRDWTTLQFNEAPVSQHQPAIRLGLSTAQAQLTRRALESLVRSAGHDDGLVEQVRGALLTLDTALEDATETQPALP